MDLTSIGKNLRKIRTEKRMMQETLAEKANLSSNYIGMIERGEKIPSLVSLIRLANALDVTADMLLCDVLTASYEVKNSVFSGDDFSITHSIIHKGHHLKLLTVAIDGDLGVIDGKSPQIRHIVGSK